MRPVVERDGETHGLWGGGGGAVRRPVLVLMRDGTPSRAGGWARVDDTGLYERQDAVRRLAAALDLGTGAVGATLARPAVMAGLAAA